MHPTPTPPERAAAHEERPARDRVRYPWHQIIEGRWQQWMELPDDTTPAEARAEGGRVRAAAADYARKHGMRVESRTSNLGRVLDLKFTKQATK